MSYIAAAAAAYKSYTTTSPWLSFLPLIRNVAAYKREYISRNTSIYMRFFLHQRVFFFSSRHAYPRKQGKRKNIFTMMSQSVYISSKYIYGGRKKGSSLCAGLYSLSLSLSPGLYFFFYSPPRN